MKKQPQQTAQTRKKLMDSFWKLYCDDGIDRVTVGAVAKDAGYNRGTFYEYFTDVYDLLDQLEDELLGELERNAAAIVGAGLPRSLHEFSMRCAQLFATHNEEVLVLLGDKGDPRFLVKVKRTMMPFFLQVTGVSEDEPNVEYLAAFMFHTMFGLVSQWHENGRDLLPEEFLEMMQTLVANGVSGFVGRPLFS